MSSLNFTQDELLEVVCACAAIRVPAYTPDYLQEFIALRLDDTDPELAGQVRQLDPGQMDALRRLVYDTQDLPETCPATVPGFVPHWAHSVA